MSTIPVFINAADKAISLARRDGRAWEAPIFVNAPTGVREWVVGQLAKVDGKATQVITWDMPADSLVEDTIKSGPNQGTKMFVLTLAVDPAPGAIQLKEWVHALDIRKRGTVDPAVASILGERPAPAAPATRASVADDELFD
jgi:hypothetical protein